MILRSFLVLFLFNLSFASEKFLVLSGGNSPSSNHYSQYLQTKGMSEFLESTFGEDLVTTFFGAGNSPESVVLADVHQTRSEGNLDYDYMIPGIIAHNKIANEENVTNYFNSKSPDTFFLLVSDHGMPKIGDETYSDNCINLWAYDWNNQNVDSSKNCFSVKTLKSKLETWAPKTVFAMSQCFSGGFHQMSVSLDNYPSANPNICGFTAITEDLYAAGCTPLVDGPHWAGYERYFTEELAGKDLVTGTVLHEPLHSLEEAHERASLRDTTIDIPTSTLDYYLTQWGKLIREENFKPRTSVLTSEEARKVFVNGTNYRIDEDSISADILEHIQKRIIYLKSLVNVLQAKLPEVSKFVEMDFFELKKKIESYGRDMNALDVEVNRLYNLSSDLRKVYLFKPWHEALIAGNIIDLTEEELLWEKDLFSKFEEENGEFYASEFVTKNLSKVFLTDEQRAVRFSKYMNSRDEGIFKFASLSKDPTILNVLQEIESNKTKMETLFEKMSAAELAFRYSRRIFALRQELGALISLSEMKDEKALKEIRGLLDCQGTQF